KEYIDAIEILENVLENSSSTNSDIEGSKYFIGLCYFKMNLYKNASIYFEEDFQNESYSSDAKSFLGICKIATGKEEEGIRNLEESIKNETNNHAYHNAILNLAIYIDDVDKSLNLFSKLYDSTFLSKNEEESELDQLRTLSLYYQSDILKSREDFIGSLIKIEKALEYSTLPESLFLKLLKYNILEVKDENIKVDIVDVIINNTLVFDISNTTPITFTEVTLKHILNFIFDLEEIDRFERLLSYSVPKLFSDCDNYELIYQIASSSKDKKEIILNYLLGFKELMSEELLMKVYKEIAFMKTNNSDEFWTYFDAYLTFFNKNEIVQGDDVYLFAIGIKLYYDGNQLRKSLDLCLNIDKRVSNIKDEKLKFEAVIIYYWYATIYRLIKDKFNSLKYSELGLELIESSNRRRTSIFDEEGLKTIKEDLLEIRNQFSTILNPINSTSSKLKFQRNDIVTVKYIDGSVVKNKFKKFENDLGSGKCMII
ncbi:hypothetical protein, partial [Flavobacterium sp.]|uniref:tetratricopeptide repeat protein n=1 Tax=Flavobacterium sp. TaxID=239 RepID=UPI00261BCF90